MSILSSSTASTNRQRAASQPNIKDLNGSLAQANGNGSGQANGSGNGNKPALLSPSQKKANHIQSEQKRRANIRRGYEALCETVPALREAIREEEEEAKRAAAANAAGLGNGNAKGKAAGKKRSSKKKDGGEDGGGKDKIDGRAGPRSENVVLSKSECPFSIAEV